MQLGVSPDEFLDTIFSEVIDATHRLPIFALPSRRAAFFTLAKEAAYRSRLFHTFRAWLPSHTAGE